MSEIKEIIVGSWKRGRKYTCLSCGKGKFEAASTVNKCPKCGQEHTVKVQI